MSDTTPAKPATLDDILAELVAIRLILAARPTPAPVPLGGSHQPSGARSAPSSTSSNADDEPIPQPNPMWALHEAEAHAVHFGKNNGVLLRDLADRSLSFYAKDKPPQLDSKGKPYPKRPIDTDLENAARTVWHYRRGTLVNGAQQPAPASTQPPKASTPAAAKASGDEDVPF